MYKIVMRVFAVTGIFSASLFAAGSLTVNAGKDTTTRLGYSFRLYPTITNTQSPNYTVEWSKSSGPLGGVVSFSAVDAESPTAGFSVPGLYVLKIIVADSSAAGKFIASDSLRINALDSIPFKIVQPVSNAKLQIGKSITIKWQVDPIGTPVSLYLSLDNGKNFNYAIANYQVKEDSLVWNIPDTLKPGSYIMLCNWYRKPSVATKVTFELVGTSIKYAFSKSQIHEIKSYNNSTQLFFLPSGRRIHSEQINGAVKNGLGVVLVKYGQREKIITYMSIHTKN